MQRQYGGGNPYKGVMREQTTSEVLLGALSASWMLNTGGGWLLSALLCI